MAKRVEHESPMDDAVTGDDAIADDPCDAIDALLTLGELINDIG
jgi:hypothetical protein